MVQMDVPGVVEDTEVQKKMRAGVEALAKKDFETALKVVSELAEDAKGGIMRGEKKSSGVYGALLTHGVMCWRPDVRDKLEGLMSLGGLFLALFADDKQEEFFALSQRLEDSADDRVAGLGMYIHALLLIATDDEDHAMNVLEDSVGLREPLSSTLLAARMVAGKGDARTAAQFLRVGLEQDLPYALALACSPSFSAVFSEEEREEFSKKLGMSSERLLDALNELFGGAKQGRMKKEMMGSDSSSRDGRDSDEEDEDEDEDEDGSDYGSDYGSEDEDEDADDDD